MDYEKAYKEALKRAKVTRNYTKRYDKGGWNQPNVKWWLDLELPKMEE